MCKQSINFERISSTFQRALQQSLWHSTESLMKDKNTRGYASTLWWDFLHISPRRLSQLKKFMLLIFCLKRGCHMARDKCFKWTRLHSRAVCKFCVSGSSTNDVIILCGGEGRSNSDVKDDPTKNLLGDKMEGMEGGGKVWAEVNWLLSPSKAQTVKLYFLFWLVIVVFWASPSIPVYLLVWGFSVFCFIVDENNFLNLFETFLEVFREISESFSSELFEVFKGLQKLFIEKSYLGLFSKIKGPIFKKFPKAFSIRKYSILTSQLSPCN